MAGVTADIIQMPSAQIPILMDPRRAPRKRTAAGMAVEKALVKALVKETEKAIEKTVQIAVQTPVQIVAQIVAQIAAQMAIDQTAPMEEALLVTETQSLAARVAEIRMVIPDLSREIREARLPGPGF